MGGVVGDRAIAIAEGKLAVWIFPGRRFVVSSLGFLSILGAQGRISRLGDAN